MLFLSLAFVVMDSGQEKTVAAVELKISMESYSIGGLEVHFVIPKDENPLMFRFLEVVVSPHKQT